MARDYIADIKTKNSAELFSMLRSISNSQPIPGWSRGRAFEHIVLRAFELEGADVTWPFDVKFYGNIVEQIDGTVYVDHLSCLIESKDYRQPINVEPIAKLRNQLLRRPAGTLGLVFARRGFTEPAKILTRMNSPLNILLWEFEELEEAIRTTTMRAALRTKYRFAVKYAMPDYNIRAR